MWGFFVLFCFVLFFVVVGFFGLVLVLVLVSFIGPHPCHMEIPKLAV